VSDRLRESARELADHAAAVSGADRDDALREVLRNAHDAVRRAAVDVDATPVDELHALADAVRASIPDPVEDALPPRIRVFVRLLRLGAVEPAWTLAADNASGFVQASSAVSTWAGPGHARTQLPLPVLIDDRAIFAWLPGLRDPRWSVPDAVYDIGADVESRARLDSGRFRADRLELAGSAWLTLLSARRDDTVELVLIDGDERVRVSARRARTPERVADSGPALTALAWVGFTAEVDLAALPNRMANWRVRIEVAQDGVRRGGPLGLHRGPLARPALMATPYEARSWVTRLSAGGRGALYVQVRPFESAAARLLPVSARAALRRVRPQAVPLPEW
jgi:hypothetical protein